MQSLKSAYMHINNNKYYANNHGTNYRISELQASILNIKLPKVDSFINKRRYIAKIYLKYLKNSGLILPIEKINCKHVFHLFVVYHSKRNLIIKKLKKNNILVNINYPYPIHKMKAYKNLYNFNIKNLYNTEKFAKGIFSLPLYPNLKIRDVVKISKTLKKVLLNIK